MFRMTAINSCGGEEKQWDSEGPRKEVQAGGPDGIRVKNLLNTCTLYGSKKYSMDHMMERRCGNVTTFSTQMTVKTSVSAQGVNSEPLADSYFDTQICETNSCLKTSSSILNRMNMSANPCQLTLPLLYIRNNWFRSRGMNINFSLWGDIGANSVQLCDSLCISHERIEDHTQNIQGGWVTCEYPVCEYQVCEYPVYENLVCEYQACGYPVCENLVCEYQVYDYPFYDYLVCENLVCEYPVYDYPV
ncbi:hypothetical protein Btru_068832, partial [Bulinus truncatus]